MKLDKNKLGKYLDGTMGRKEQLEVEHLLNTNGEEPDVKKIVEDDWTVYINSGGIVEKDLEHILKKIHEIKHMKDVRKKKSITKKMYQWYARIAAIIIIPLLVTALASLLELDRINKLLDEKSTLISLNAIPGTRLDFQLPDGTEGVLNGGASIHYSVPFSNRRDVKLEGEAFFEVEHDPEHPFVVNANRVDVRVLGTKFSVCALPGEDLTQVVLEKGKVECSFNDKTNKVVMNPDESVVIRGREVIRTEINAAIHHAWIEGKLIFRGDSMDEVAKKIAAWYNVEVEVADKELKAYSFKATSDNDSLEELLHLLTLTSPIKYKILERQALPDGSFSKKKVILFKRK